MHTDNKDNRRNTMDSTNSSSSSSSASSRTSTKIKSALVRLSGIFSRSTTSSTLASSNIIISANRRSSSSSSNSSVNTPPSSLASLDMTSPTAATTTTHGRKKKWIERDSAISDISIPPFSPTYCKPNEFPYSNFYMKLPNGKWMIRYRSGTRNIIGTDEFDGYMI